MSWPYTSHKELQEACFLWQRTGTCARCRRIVHWYRNPNQKLVPVDPGTFRIHFATCEVLLKQREEAKAKVIKFPSGGHRQKSFTESAGVLLDPRIEPQP